MPIHDTSDGPIELLREGSGADSMLMLHAAASGPRALYKLASVLGQSGWACGLPALNGYGATELRDADAADPFSAHVRVARWAFGQWQPAEPVRRRILMGHSMGGLIALLTALEEPAADALILYEPIVLDCLDATDLLDMAAKAWDGACIETLHERFAAGEPEVGVAAFVEGYNEIAWHQLPAALRAELVSKAANLVAETRSAQALRLDRAKLKALRMPVLILQGSKSPDVTHRMTAGLARAIPHAQRLVVDGIGHMGPVMTPKSVAEAIFAFITRLPPRDL